MLRQIEAKVYGKVQGVYFRVSAFDRAVELGINGIVRNENDGSVYIKAEGESDKINDFINWLKTGPDKAEVEKLDFKEMPTEGIKSFKIDY